MDEDMGDAWADAAAGPGKPGSKGKGGAGGVGRAADLSAASSGAILHSCTGTMRCFHMTDHANVRLCVNTLLNVLCEYRGGASAAGGQANSGHSGGGARLHRRDDEADAAQAVRQLQGVQPHDSQARGCSQQSVSTVACTPLLTQAGIARPPPAPWRHTQTGQHLNKRRFACREGASKVFQMPLTPAQIARNAVLGTILRPITINPSDAASGGAACFIPTNTGTNAMRQLCNYPAWSISQLVRAEMLPVVMLAPVMLMQRLPGWSRSLRRSWPQAGRPAMQRPSRHL